MGNRLRLDISQKSGRIGSDTLINRDDMLELTRRMTPSRTCFDRIAGTYISEDGEVDDSFNIHFLKLSGSEKARNLEIAKAIPFSKTNVQLKEYTFPASSKGKDSMHQLLKVILSCGLKNDALLYVLYELLADGFPVDYHFAIYLFHGIYDIPAKAKDKTVLGESEEIYEFIIGAICPLKDEYEPEEPVLGFLYPAFSDRSADYDRIDIYHKNPEQEEEGLLYKFFGKR